MMSILKYVDSDEAYDKLHKSIKAMCGVTLDIFTWIVC